MVAGAQFRIHSVALAVTPAVVAVAPVVVVVVALVVAAVPVALVATSTMPGPVTIPPSRCQSDQVVHRNQFRNR